MNDEPENPPDLEDRFLPPANWKWQTFSNSKGHTLRFGYVSPENPKAIVVGLQGLSEFTEKYYETARDILKMNMAFWMMDWQGQGLSERHLKNRHKRHSAGFEEDISDLHHFLTKYIKSPETNPNIDNIPFVMLGHSMGGNIGLHYLHKYPDTFTCAAFTAPMIGMYDLRKIPEPFCLILTATLNKIIGKMSTGSGGTHWDPEGRSTPGESLHSSDAVRDSIHSTWFHHNTDLQVGDVTYGWLHESNIACHRLQKKSFISNIKTPCLFAIAGHEVLVDNCAARKALQVMPDHVILEFPAARHEILMEKDEYRQLFFDRLQTLLIENGINE